MRTSPYPCSWKEGLYPLSLSTDVEADGRVNGSTPGFLIALRTRGFGGGVTQPRGDVAVVGHLLTCFHRFFGYENLKALYKAE